LRAFRVAFFPILANIEIGLSSVDHSLLDPFQMSKALRCRLSLRPSRPAFSEA
jgi:hypothetical protein